MEEDIGRKCDVIAWLHFYDYPTHINTLVSLAEVKLAIEHQWLSEPTRSKTASKYIKTHGSVSCGPRSRRATPVSY